MTNRKRFVVVSHGHCFDGLCSAVMFTRLVQHLYGEGSVAFTYHAAGYGPAQNGVDPKLLAGDENAILDFRFSTSPKLTWYFDHHVSAFPTPGDREVFDARVRELSALGPKAQRFFHDGAYTSCTKLIADVSAERFGVDPKPMERLVAWADMIDSAAFPNAQMAVERKDPVLRLMTVVEHTGDDAFLTKFVGKLLTQPIEEVAQSAEVNAAYEPLGKQHEAFVSLVSQRAKEDRGVVVVDLSDQLIEVAGKFVTYALYPESAYSVLLSRAKSKCKISIGYNPWSSTPRRHNIAAICERHGGGGHPVVGAISLPPDKVEDARRLSNQIAEELRS